jgi:hypothetical protein
VRAGARVPPATPDRSPSRADARPSSFRARPPPRAGGRGGPIARRQRPGGRAVVREDAGRALSRELEPEQAGPLDLADHPCDPPAARGCRAGLADRAQGLDPFPAAARGEGRLPLGRRHPLILELDVAAGAVALLLGDPAPVELDPAERAVRLLVVGQDREQPRVGFPGLARERLALRPASQLAPRLGVAGGDARGSRPVLLEGRGAFLDADDAGHRRGEVAAADVDRDGVLGLLDDRARKPAASPQVDLIREEGSGHQSDDHGCSLHSCLPAVGLR